jgi:hypothetical protein
MTNINKIITINESVDQFAVLLPTDGVLVLWVVGFPLTLYVVQNVSFLCESDPTTQFFCHDKIISVFVDFVINFPRATILNYQII